MRDAEAWAPSKFVRTRRGWGANRAIVPLASWIAADGMAGCYAGMIERHARGRLIDLGCGAAPLYAMYGERATEVVCVDWRDGRHDQRHVDLFHDLNDPLELEPESFDTAVASDVVEHLHTPQALFDSAARLLRPGGALILGTPFFYWLHEEPHDYHRYTRHALERMTRRAGLRSAELETYGGAPEILCDVLIKSVMNWPRLSRAIHAAARPALRARPVRRYSAASAPAFPFGYVMTARKPAVA